MALITTITCVQCKQEKDVSHSACGGPPLICSECEQQNLFSARTNYLNARRAKSTEERLADIEAQLYDHFRNHPQSDFFSQLIG